MLRAWKLEVDLYEEVEADSTATGQAFAVVLIVAIAGGIGGGIAAIMAEDAKTLSFLWGLLVGIGTAIVGWLAWSVIAYLLGTTIFKGPQTEATVGQLMRTLGFSNTPRLLGIFAFVPYVGWLISLVGSVWALIAGVIAVRQALDFSTWRAIGTCVVGWIIYMVLVFIVALLVPGI
ncbi:MAG: YIP1 family protein [Dehalococcoidia bacterium]|nr:YIP1 family protein [Dehalococcoidia bacterium]